MRRWSALLVVGVLLGSAGCAADDTAGGANSPAPETASAPVETNAPPSADSSEQAAPSPSQPTPVVDGWVLTTEGFGPLEIGGLVPEDLRADFDAGWECFGPTLVHPEHGGIEVWSEDGTVETTITGLSLADHNSSTDAGVWVGMSSEELHSTHPDLVLVPEADPLGELDVYTSDEAAEGAPSIFYEVEDDAASVVGVSVQASDEYHPVSNRVCGGP